MPPRPETHRTVKPRKHGYVHRPLLVIDQEAIAQTPDGPEVRPVCFWELTGEVRPLSEFAFRLESLPSSFVVCQHAARLLRYLTELFGQDPLWQYRVTPVRRSIMGRNGEIRENTIEVTLVNFFGWKRNTKKVPPLYYYPMDASLFTRMGVGDILPETGTRLERLARWGEDVRAWCRGQNLTVHATSGGIGAQLLRDPRFWPDARRKVPKRTNARIRPILPGNYYKLHAEVGVPYQAYYLDMSSAHHTIAASLRFPHPDSLTARGMFRVSDKTDVTVSDGRPWLPLGTTGIDHFLERYHGLLYVRLRVSEPKRGSFPPPYLEKRGDRMVWVFTNELPMIRELGGRIEGVDAAWVSPTLDPGMNAYAEFALAEIARAQESRRRWMKGTLLAAYGVLAAQERVRETAYYRTRSERAVERQYAAGSGMLRVQAFIGKKPNESPIVNVLYRGMIEAEQRLQALGMARYLHRSGCRVLAIYADSVFIESTTGIPMLPPEWRVKTEVDDLHFWSATHMTSKQFDKLPGVPQRSSGARAALIARRRAK